MSLDVSLYVPRTGRDEQYTANITHNLNRMAEEAGVYQALWHPEDFGIIKAKQLIVPLLQGLIRLHADPGRFKALNPSNGWGTYEDLVQFVELYLDACKRFPEATVEVSR